MESYKFSKLTPDMIDSLKHRRRINIWGHLRAIGQVVDGVQMRGDAAVREHTAVGLEKIVEEVSNLPDPELDANVREAFDVAYDNIHAFHLAQKSPEMSIENTKGVRCKRVPRSIGSVGLYVPGGTAVLPSTALMLAVPAQIAGCRTVVLATHPRHDGSICEEVLYCAKKAGVTHILKAGGAQGMAAMAWGTYSCPKVDKIFGPGNQYVTAAKMFLQNSEAMVDFDMPAGPSDVLVIADKYASPVHIVADLLSQALYFWAGGRRRVLETMQAGQIMSSLPTYGCARMHSGVSRDSFRKYMTVQSLLTEEGSRNLRPYVAAFYGSSRGIGSPQEILRLRYPEAQGTGRSKHPSRKRKMKRNMNTITENNDTWDST